MFVVMRYLQHSCFTNQAYVEFRLPGLDFTRGQAAGQNQRQTEASCIVYVVIRDLQQLFVKQQQKRHWRLKKPPSQAKLLFCCSNKALRIFLSSCLIKQTIKCEKIKQTKSPPNCFLLLQGSEEEG